MVGQPLRPRRHVPPIPAEVLRRIFDEDRAFNRQQPGLSDGTLMLLGVLCACIAAVVIAYCKAHGWIVR